MRSGILPGLMILMLCLPASSQARQKLSITFAGFYQSHASLVKPARVSNVNQVTLRQVHNQFSRQFDHLYEVAPHGYIKSLLRRQGPHIAQGLRLFLDSTLNHTNRILAASRILATSKGICPYCQNRFPVTPAGWQYTDRVVIFTGLEVLTPDSQLHSALTAVAFDGNGNFIGIETALDSRHNDDQNIMLQTCLELLDRLGVNP